jgi:hypothetical protein
MFAPEQERFSKALLDPETDVPAALAAHSEGVPERRFAVYRNNVVAGLVNALAARFPAVQRIVGEEFFRAMAQVYVRAHPPRSRLLMTYGDNFADFIAGFEPAAELEYLADVARLEGARTRAFHAADALPVDSSALQSIGETTLGDLRFVPHPAAEIVRSAFPIVTIWAMNSGERELEAIEDWRGEDALVVRPQFDVFVRALPAGGAIFLAALFSGSRLADAIHAAQAEHEEFDLAANLAGLISSAAVAQIIIPN